MVSVKFNDQHIPDSPFKVHVAPSTGDVQKLTVESLQEQSLQVTQNKLFVDCLVQLWSHLFVFVVYFVHSCCLCILLLF